MDNTLPSAHLYQLLCDFCAFGVVILAIWSCVSAFNSRGSRSREISAKNAPWARVANPNLLAEPIEDPPVRIKRPPELGIQLAKAIHSYRMEHDDIR
jgi:hypothetical protein